MKFTDNSKKVLSEFDKAVEKGLEAIGLTGEGHTKEIITQAPRVDTGRYRNSITWAIAGKPANISSYSGMHGEEGTPYSGTAPKNGDEKAVYIGSNVEYAVYNEYGTVNMSGIHAIQRGATEPNDEFKKLMKQALTNH